MSSQVDASSDSGSKRPGYFITRSLRASADAARLVLRLAKRACFRAGRTSRAQTTGAQSCDLLTWLRATHPRTPARSSRACYPTGRPPNVAPHDVGEPVLTFLGAPRRSIRPSASNSVASAVPERFRDRIRVFSDPPHDPATLSGRAVPPLTSSTPRRTFSLGSPRFSKASRTRTS